MATFVSVVLLGFGVSLLFAPQLSPLTRRVGRLLKRPAHSVVARKKRAAPMLGKGAPVVMGFYTPWEPASLESLSRRAKHLTHLAPVWLHLDPKGRLAEEEDPNRDEAVRLARANDVRILPVLANAEDDRFYPARGHAALDRAGALAHETADWVTGHGFQGINLDIEELTDADQARMAGFVTAFRKEFAPRKLEVTVDVQAGDDHMGEIAKASDFAVLMAYDQHQETSGPGPIAPVDWVGSLVQKAVAQAPADKIVLGIGSYAYDWPKQGKAQSLTFADAMAQAAGYRDPDDHVEDVIDFDSTSLNAHYEYDDDANQAHNVWMLDAASAWNAWAVSRPYGIRGAALWALGSEDPGIWTFLDPKTLSGDLDPKSLAAVDPDSEVELVGKGDILRLAADQQNGERTVEVDPNERLVTDEIYHRFPSGYILRQSGAKPKTLAISFDDGPSPEWTPPILDILKAKHVPATFFVIGENANSDPDLVRRMVAEGHEVGSHSFTHPNLSLASDTQTNLELTATERSIEAITGRATTLFRPPYNADSRPSTAAEVRPLERASNLGYITVGESIDPSDWDLSKLQGEAKTNQIVEDTLTQAEVLGTGEILLHDAGGDRSATVAALPRLIDALRAKGFRLVATSTLDGSTRDAAMPPLTGREKWVAALSGVVLGSAFKLSSWLSVAFVTAIALGAARVIFVAVLAVFHRRRPIPTGPMPTVSVVIAAYNEVRVIARTVQSALACDPAPLEVIVIDDGSSDGTFEAIPTDDPRVVAIRKENGGKASALNEALAITKGEIMVGLDADTLLAPDALGLLARRMADPEVGAVAGNIRVGNEDNLITLWQSVEYTISQNLDRRAYATLNAVTVVPGALGAWRTSLLRELGGYRTDTLAEDMDLTWRVRRAGWRIETETDAVACTEAPDTLSAFLKQRARWTFGTLQCLWKHRDALGRYGWFGRLALPMLWVFGFLFQLLAPLIDLGLLVTVLHVVQAATSSSVETTALPAALANLRIAGALFGAFLLLEGLVGVLAFVWERRPLWPLASLPLQRLVYRQALYAVAWRAVRQAITGRRAGWNKLDRKGTVQA
ncbi:glycosyltransferase [soil metagenome]